MLYFTSVKGITYFSENLKYLLKVKKNKFLNKNKITDYFTFISDAGSETFYEDIFKTCPREHLKLVKENTHRVKYFDFEIATDTRSEHEISNDLRDLFIHSVRNCSQKTSEKVFSACSGGLDSSSITSSLCTEGKKQVVAKTIIFDGLYGKDLEKTDEIEYSRSVTEKYKIEHDLIHLQDDGCVSDLPSVLNIFDEPKSLVNGFIHHAIFKSLAMEQSPIYLDGFAGDSVINHGYSALHHHAKKLNYARLFREDKKIHHLRGAQYRYLRTFKKYVIPSLLPGSIMKILYLIKGRRNIYENWSARINKRNRYQNLNKQILQRYQVSPEIYANTTQQWHRANLISPEISSSIRDAIELAQHYGVEVYFPYLSKKLMQLNLNIPNNLKLKDGTDRYIFRKAMTDILPEKVRKRVVKSDLSPFSTTQISKIDKKALINKLKSRSGQFFNYDHIINNVFKNIKENTTEIYQLYEFAEWLEKNDLYLD